MQTDGCWQTLSICLFFSRLMYSLIFREFQLAKVVQHITQQKQQQKIDDRQPIRPWPCEKKFKAATQRHQPEDNSLRLKAHGVFQKKKQNSRGTKTATHQRGTNRFNVFTQRTFFFKIVKKKRANQNANPF
jgi:hypothetical protein